MKSPCDHESTFLSAARFAATSAAPWNRSTQTGARAATTAALVRCVASASAAPPVTHPPHEKPTTAKAIAPATAPQRAGFVSTGIFMTDLSNESDEGGQRDQTPSLSGGRCIIGRERSDFSFC